MCKRDRPTLVTSSRKNGILLRAVPRQAYALDNHRLTLTTNIPHRAIGRMDLRDDLRQHVALLSDQRIGDPVQRRAPGRPDRCDVALARVLEYNYNILKSTKGTRTHVHER